MAIVEFNLSTCILILERERLKPTIETPNVHSTNYFDVFILKEQNNATSSKTLN